MKIFTDTEINLLDGNYSKIAERHNCDRTYVSQIAKGKKDALTIKAKKILIDLIELVIVLS